MEESLKEFAGAVVLISHDRCLMDRVCTQILGLGMNNEHQFFADYSQWEQACEPIIVPEKEVKLQSKPASAAKTKKLSYHEQKELEGMEARILAIEEQITTLQQKLEDPEVQTNAQKSLELYHQLAEAQQKHDLLFQRWEFLESQKQ